MAPLLTLDEVSPAQASGRYADFDLMLLRDLTTRRARTSTRASSSFLFFCPILFACLIISREVGEDGHSLTSTHSLSSVSVGPFWWEGCAAAGTAEGLFGGRGAPRLVPQRGLLGRYIQVGDAEGPAGQDICKWMTQRGLLGRIYTSG
jgi:hypothetical protein